jgi:signal transduction histidine kinase
VRFTSDASHELRTPVALVRTTAEIAIGRDRSADEYRHALVEIAGEAARMSTLVDDLLRLARADAGVDDAENAAVDLRGVGAIVVGEVAALAEAKGVTVDVCQPDAPVVVMGHERSLVRLGRAVIDNALKYTPSGGRVRIVLTVEGDSGSTRAAVLRVSDTGTGVSAKDAPWIFDRFFRGRDARARGFAGSGLGLSLARALAERAGGSIALVTPSDLGGATFEIRIPTAPGSGRLVPRVGND